MIYHIVLTCVPDVTDSYTSLCMGLVDPAKIPQGTESTCSCFAQVNGEDYPDYGKLARISTLVSS